MRACRSGIILFRNNDAYRCLVIEHVTGPPAPKSSKKYGPRIKDAENLHRTVTFGECSGTCKDGMRIVCFPILAFVSIHRTVQMKGCFICPEDIPRPL
ncbi:hypothetical protein TNCV_5067581 [Trichonephila clavipes]|nr:hypothetical protein TNCV_5067581 [Trichonephila clavipes]